MVNTTISPLVLILMTFVAYGQKIIVIDGDKLHLRDSLGGKVILLTSIEREDQNRDALGLPMTQDHLAFLDKNFINYWTENSINILGVFITYDDCICFKTKTASSPDMYLIHFKISSADWTKMKELYPDMISYIRQIN